MRKLLVIFVLTLTSLTLFAGKKVEEEKFTATKLIVGMECAYAPYNWTTPTDTDTAVPIDGTNAFCDGYDIKIAQQLADELGVELVVKAIEWDGLIPALTAGNIDAIIAGMSPTAERKETISFTNQYFRSEQVVVVKNNSTFANATSIKGFTGAKISAQLGTLQEGIVVQMTGAVAATSLSDYPTLVTALNSGTIDGFIAELPVATQVVNNNSGLKIVSFTGTNGFTLEEEDVTTSIGVRKTSTDLLNKLNEALAKISVDQRNTWMNEFVDKSSE